MTKYTITFEENGGEYVGSLWITTPHEIEKVDATTIKIGDFTTIAIDEPIISIQEGATSPYKRPQEKRE
jgi:hypothetical protein